MDITKKNKIYLFISILTIIFLFSFAALCNQSGTDTEEEETYVSKEEAAAEEVIGDGGEEAEEENSTEELGEVEEPVEAEKVEDPVLIRLDEIQQQYSLEFRQYLESLEKDYLENILSDDNAAKAEYDLFEWRNIFYRDEIIFTADKDIFPGYWYDPEINAKAESLSEGEIDRSRSIIISALDKYPIEVLKDNLKSVYALKSMNFYGVDYGGTNSKASVYVVNVGEDMGYSDICIEESFHHEFSSVLLRKYKQLFDESGWRQINPDGFEYFDEATGGSGAIREGKDSQEFDPELHEMGFLYQYAGSTLENDFNSFAENIFMGEESFFKTVEGYEKLKAKLDLIIEFYNAVNPRFTIEYFKGI